MKRRVQERARLVEVTPVGRRLYWLRLEAPRLIAGAPPAPGQFLHVQVDAGYDPLLRRPLSILDVDETAGLVELYLQVVGKGSGRLASLTPGAEVDILGPLGRGFRDAAPGSSLYLAAGGVGLAPLYFLARRLERLASPQSPGRVIFLLGARSREELPDGDFLGRLPADLLLATDDGSRGHRGTVIDLLRHVLSQEDGKRELAGCGPPRMLAALAELAARLGLPCQVSLEQAMGCGVGACQGCVVRAGGEYARVCTEGPVLEAAQVDWQHLLISGPHAERMQEDP